MMIDKLHEDILKENIQNNGLDEEEIDSAIEAWQHTKALVPKDFDEVVSSEKCLFCKSDEPSEKACYADIMIAHKEPLTKKASILSLGKKNRTAAIGSILPLKLAICKDCKRSFVMAYSLKISILILFVVAAILMVSFVDVGVESEQTGYIIYWGFAIVISFVGYIVGKIVTNKYIERKSKDVKFNIFEIDLFDRMKQKGWFLLSDDKTITTFGFTKKENEFGRIFDKNE